MDDKTQLAMPLAQFKASVQELNSKDAAKLRSEYINHFIDTTSDFFKKYIEVLELHVDGWCYEGYLWDCIRNPTVISFVDLIASLQKGYGFLYIMWDIHSRDKVREPDYWKFDRAAVLALPPEVLVQNLCYLPEDLYIFDRELNWTFVITHEETHDNARLCVSARH